MIGDESNVLEKALKAQKLKRYHYDKNLGTTSSKSKEESEGVVATRDASKKAKQILEGACDAPDPVSIKYIYICSVRTGIPSCQVLRVCISI